ncbi:MAG: hypothetical protein ACK5S1_00520, partial [bacterium]
MQKIKFRSTVYSTQYGTLAEGDLLACSDEYAAHFVDELKVAERLAPAPVPAAAAAPDSGAPAP